MKVSAASATMPDSGIEMPATEYSTSPSDAATSTMQIAMKMVEIRITRANVLEIPERDRSDLSIIADSPTPGAVENSGGYGSSASLPRAQDHLAPIAGRGRRASSDAR